MLNGAIWDVGMPWFVTFLAIACAASAGFTSLDIGSVPTETIFSESLPMRAWHTPSVDSPWHLGRAAFYVCFRIRSSAWTMDARSHLVEGGGVPIWMWKVPQTNYSTT